MTRSQQRRVRVVALVVTLLFCYSLWQRGTWSPTPVAVSPEAAKEPAPAPAPPPAPSSLKKEPDVHVDVNAPPVKLKVQPGGGEIPTSSLTPTLSTQIPVANVAPVDNIPVQAAQTPLVVPPPKKTCPQYEQLQRAKHGPLSAGKRKFPYSRPDPECRTFNLPSLEALIQRMKGLIKDPDLFRLFENAYPNTLDTCIKWRGYANSTDAETGETVVTDEELAFVITGDINAMWLRDSASQVYSYLPLLEPSTDPDSLASLWRGLINSHARYIIISPYCHSFQPPAESFVNPTHNGAYLNNKPIPPYDPKLVFDCKWELDSLASFLQISVAYYERTGDLKFFQKYKWIEAVEAAVKAAGAMRLGTYSKEGKVEDSAWKFTGYTNRGSETLTNDGLGNPTKENGMVRTAFRPSDDACIYQLLVPANMMWAKYLEEASKIMAKLQGPQAEALTKEMNTFATGIRKGIEEDAIVKHKEFGDIFAYEIDGYGGANLMDDGISPQ
jgi:meiotically up-regulated gene 157 (Mug157) protein